jgi:GTP-binding protein HflX
MLPEDRANAVRERAARDENVLAISAVSGEGLEVLQTTVAEALQGALRTEQITLTFAQGRQRAWLFGQEVVVEEAQTDEGFVLTVRWSADVEAAYQRL